MLHQTASWAVEQDIVFADWFEEWARARQKVKLMGNNLCAQRGKMHFILFMVCCRRCHLLDNNNDDCRLDNGFPIVNVFIVISKILTIFSIPFFSSVFEWFALLLLSLLRCQRVDWKKEAREAATTTTTKKRATRKIIVWCYYNGIFFKCCFLQSYA